jgi:EmrB/QacA subfamily drug resistance transporter
VKKKSATISESSVIIIAAMSSFLTPFTSSSVNIALPTIGTDLHLNAISLSWVATAYLLAAAAFLVPFGRFADIAGRKRIFRIGILIDVTASILAAFSKSGEWLIVFRAFQGLGGAMIFGTGVAILTSVIPPRRRGRALGINVAAVYTGLAVGPLIGGIFTGHFGWRAIFFLNAFLGLLITGMVSWKLIGEWAGAQGEKYDYGGALIYILSIVTFMYALSVLPALWGFWLVLLGAIGFAVFVIWENRQAQPVFNIALFRNNAVFAFSNLAALINYSATFAVGFLLSLYLQYVKGFSPEHAGLILIAQPLIMVVFSPLAGSLSDRLEPRIVASLGMALTTLGLLILTFLGKNSGLGIVLIALVVLGLGFGLFSSPNTNAVMGSVDKKFYGVASGVLGTMRLTGQMASMALAFMLFSFYIGKVQITPEVYPLFLKSMRMIFMLSTALCFLGIFASIARGKTHSRQC